MEPDWLAELKRLKDLKASTDDMILKAVKGARRDGLPWEGIGKSLGVTGQAAHEKFTKLGVSRVKRPRAKAKA